MGGRKEMGGREKMGGREEMGGREKLYREGSYSKCTALHHALLLQESY